MFKMLFANKQDKAIQNMVNVMAEDIIRQTTESEYLTRSNNVFSSIVNNHYTRFVDLDNRLGEMQFRNVVSRLEHILKSRGVKCVSGADSVYFIRQK